MSSWKVTLPCTRAEADALTGDISVFATMDSPPVLMTSEADSSRPDDWRLDAYFDGKPSKANLAMLKALVPSAAASAAVAEPVAEQDWVTLSQQGLEPIRAGRFFVHTPQHRGEVPAGAVALEIDAGLAFGTGHHETTTGCLEVLDWLKASGLGFGNIIDVGTGTGLLAFAALRLWPAAKAIASDIDPVSIDVTRDNAAVNGVRLGRARGQLELAVAPGVEHGRIRARAPYDLILANILAGPLIDLAPSIAAVLAPGGRLVLAGLLDQQAAAVAAAYRRQDMALIGRNDRGEWPTLLMRKRRTARPRVRRSAPPRKPETRW